MRRCCADEVAFWRSDETSLNPDVEILRALRPGMVSIPGAVLLMASSPYSQRGELYNTYRRHFGKDDARVLVWKASTLQMNPSVDKRIIDEAYENDPESAKAEFGGEFRTDLADFVSRETVDAVTMWDRHELPPEPGVTYIAFCRSVGRRLGLVDPGDRPSRSQRCLHSRRVARDVGRRSIPRQAVAQCAALLRRYGVAKIVGDKYAGEWPRARFAEHGIEFEQSARPKCDLYHDLLPLLNARRVELLDLPRLSAQLCGLERRTARCGRDSIDHAPGGHDDLANAVAGVLVKLDLDRRQPLIRIERCDGRRGRGPALAPVRLRDDGRRGGRHRDRLRRFGRGTCARRCTSSTLRSSISSLDCGPSLSGTSRRWRSRGGLWGCSRPSISPFSFQIRASEAQALRPEFDPELMLTFAAECIGAGLVKFCPAVTAKMKT